MATWSESDSDEKTNKVDWSLQVYNLNQLNLKAKVEFGEQVYNNVFDTMHFNDDDSLLGNTKQLFCFTKPS